MARPLSTGKPDWAGLVGMRAEDDGNSIRKRTQPDMALVNQAAGLIFRAIQSGRLGWDQSERCSQAICSGSDIRSRFS